MIPVSEVLNRFQEYQPDLEPPSSSLQAEVQALKSQAPAGNLARKVQTNFLLSITGVLLGVAAVAMAIFW